MVREIGILRIFTPTLVNLVCFPIEFVYISQDGETYFFHISKILLCTKCVQYVWCNNENNLGNLLYICIVSLCKYLLCNFAFLNVSVSCQNLQSNPFFFTYLYSGINLSMHTQFSIYLL